MPSIASRLGLLLALLLPSIALAETAPLNVPILMHGSIGDDACPEKGCVVEAGSESGSFLPVQSGPGEAPFREIGRLHDGDMVMVCEKLGPWLGWSTEQPYSAAGRRSLYPSSRRTRDPATTAGSWPAT
jgi:hypothetical protein